MDLSLALLGFSTINCRLEYAYIPKHLLVGFGFAFESKRVGAARRGHTVEVDSAFADFYWCVAAYGRFGAGVKFCKC